MPELGPLDQTLADPSHLYDAVMDMLTRWTKQAPVLVLLDDIQGLDKASAGLLNYVIRVMHHAPIGFACSARPQELETNLAASQVVKVLRRDRRIRPLSLLPLDTQTTLALAYSVDANLEAGQIYTNSGGNPLFMLLPKCWPCLVQHNVKWVRSIFSINRNHTITEFNAPDAETVRTLYRRLGMPFDLVWTAESFTPESLLSLMPFPHNRLNFITILLTK